MPCYKPLHGYRSFGEKTESGKRPIVFNSKAACGGYRVDLPCGQCIGCRIDRARTWSLRCMHEASLYENNCFVTLTFDEDHLPVNGSLNKRDFQLFMKRLRKRCVGLDVVDGKRPIRYFHCGEYGENMKRPHHHACLFNFDFLDKELWSIKNGIRLYRSELLEDLWPFGFSLIGDVTVESANYVARYCIKKITGDDAALHYVSVDEDTGEMFYLEPEYITMSRRPGIGQKWYEEYRDSDVYSKDFVTSDGKAFKVPAYYDKLEDMRDHFSMLGRKRGRRLKADEHSEDHTVERLNARERVARARVKRLVRSFENGATDF